MTEHEAITQGPAPPTTGAAGPVGDGPAGAGPAAPDEPGRRTVPALYAEQIEALPTPERRPTGVVR